MVLKMDNTGFFTSFDDGAMKKAQRWVEEEEEETSTSMFFLHNA